jgi:hypothetical protein
LVSVAVTVTCGDVGASTVVDGAGPVTNATSVKVSDAVVHIVADAILICVSSTVSSADIQGVQLVSITVAVSGRDVRATTFIDVARTSTHAAEIVRFASAIIVGGQRVVVASRLLGASWNLVVVANAVIVHICRAGAAADTNGVQLVSVAVTVSFGDVGASTVVDGARSIADATSVKVSDAIVNVVTDAVLVCVSSTVTTAHVNGVQLVAVAVTVSCRDLCTSTVVDGAGTVTNATSVKVSDAVVHVVTDAILVCVSSTITTADIQGVQLVSVTVAVSGGYVGATTGVDFARAIADATSV